MYPERQLSGLPHSPLRLPSTECSPNYGPARDTFLHTSGYTTRTEAGTEDNVG
jgi:hypothetical protein